MTVNRGTDADSPRAPRGGRWAVLLTVALTCFVGQSFARFSFGLLLPAMKTDLRVSYGLAGWLGTINLAGYLLGTILTSIASTRVPAHRIMQAGVGLATMKFLESAARQPELIPELQTKFFLGVGVIDSAFIIATGLGLWFATANPFKA